MEKLKLEHLAPYLPYGLKLYHVGYKAKHILDTSIKEGVYDREMSAITLTSMVNGSEYLKPILRPLSDLTKEIEHNGERFVPIEVIDKHNNLELLDCLNDETFDFPKDIVLFPFWLVNSLIEWHFDVFGLINKGLAIDINTIQEGEAK